MLLFDAVKAGLGVKVMELHSRGMGVAGILKLIRSMEDEKGNRFEIGQTSVYQIIADYRKQTEAVVTETAFRAAQHV
jgi:hypothetical protein